MVQPSESRFVTRESRLAPKAGDLELRRFVPMALGAAVLGLFFAMTVSSGAEEKLPSEIEAKLKNGISRLLATKKQARLSEAPKVIKDVVTVTGLNVEGAKELEAAYPAAVEQSMEPWSNSLLDAWRGMYWASGPQFVESVENIMPSMALNSRNLCDGGTKPEDQTSWQEALKQILSSEQFAKWEKEAADRKKRKDKEVGQLITNALDQFRDRQFAELARVRSDIKSAAGLDEAAAKRLDDFGSDLVKRLQPEWESRIRRVFTSFSDDMRRSFLSGGIGFGMTRLSKADEAVNHADWRKAIVDTLTPQQLAAWERAKEGERTEAEKQVREHVRGQLDAERTRLTAEAESLVDEVEKTFQLSGDRLKRLQAATQAAIRERSQQIETERMAALLAMDEPERQQVIASNAFMRFSLRSGRTHRLETQSSWTRAIQETLVTEEQRRWRAASEEHQSRRLDAMVRLLVTEMDRMILLTAGQRKEIEQVMRAVVEGNPNPGMMDGTSMVTYYIRLLSADQQKAVAVALDDVQRKAWNGFDEMEARMYGLMDGGEGADERGGDGPPVEVERAVSDYLFSAAQDERRQRQDAMQARVADVKRASGLGEREMRLLQVAAKGAVERSLRDWERNAESYVSSQVQDATPETVRTLLGGPGQLRFSFGNAGNPADELLWRNMLKSMLPEAQRGAWEAAVASRENYRMGAVARLAVAKLDECVRLTADQHSKLLPLVENVVRRYFPSYEAAYGNRGMIQTWFIGAFVIGVPEESIRSLLTPAQWTAWSEEVEKDLGNQWNYIKSRAERSEQRRQ